MRILFFVLLALSVSMAADTELMIYEQRDLGVEYENDFDNLYITMDCETNDMIIYVRDNGAPVTGAVVRLIYVDYSVPLLASGPTTSDGRFTYKLIGERDFMTGLFLAVVEKEGYKNKEAHFDIMRCIEYEEEIPPPPPEELEEEIEELEEEVEELEEEVEELEEEVEELEEEIEQEVIEENETVEINVTENVTGEPEEEGYVCVPALILLLFSFLSLMKQ